MSAATEIGITGLRASEPETLPFGRSLQIRAFVLEREQGNIAVYSTTTLENTGDITRQYLNHSHEALFGGGSLGVPLFFHEAERPDVTARPRGTFSRRHTFEHNFEVIPTPGHTPGATAYLWDNGDHRMLFTGDTIMLDNGEWKAAVLATSDVDAYLESLWLLRELDFDVLVPWVASAGGPYYAFTDHTDARRRIDAIIARLQRSVG